VAAAEMASAKERALRANPELLQTYGEDLVSLMVQVRILLLHNNNNDEA
jgi:hypothetical protein